MSDLIRMLGMKMSHKGTCNKCGEPTDKGNHSKCYRWPTQYGGSKGFYYVANARETNLTELKNIVAVICSGDADETPVRFEIKIIQTRNCEEVKSDD
jgi:hypothetical protein